MPNSGSAGLIDLAQIGPPRLASGLVPRPWLSDLLFGIESVGLVCAPAGYGKTTLVAQASEAATREGESVAWLSLGDSDNGVFPFWSAVVAAFAATSAAHEATAFDQLVPPQRGVEPGFIEILGRSIESTSGLRALVLDDVQKLADRDVIASLDLFLTRLPPRFTVILVCRSDPALNLSRLRLAGQLREIRTEQLVFTETDAGELMDSLNVQIQPSDVRRLVARTEGWAAGLRLAAASVAGSSDVERFVDSFDGDERTVADYLFEAVLASRSPDMIDFLISTCVPEHLSAALAAQLSGVARAGEILEELTRANALVMQSGNPTWYRYHSLLRGYLAALATRRDPDEIVRQHRITANWSAANNRPELALQHAALAGANALLLTYLEAYGLRLVLSGRAALVRSLIDGSPEEVRAEPVAAAIGALSCLDLGDLLATDSYLSLAANADSALTDRMGALCDAVLVRRSTLGGDIEAALAQTEILERTLTGDVDLDLIVLAYRANARARIGDMEGAFKDAGWALQLARDRGYDEFALTVASQLAWLAGSDSDIAAMMHWSQEAIAATELAGRADSPRVLYAYVIRATVGFATGDLDGLVSAAKHAASALAIESPPEAELSARTVSGWAQVELASGPERRAAVLEFRDLWRSPIAAYAGPVLAAWGALTQIQFALSVGELQWASDVVMWTAAHLPESGEAVTVRAILVASRGRASEALTVLGPVLRGEVVSHDGMTTPTAWLLTAVLRSSLGDATLAHEALTRAVDWSAPRQFRRPFLDAWPEVAPLLAASLGRFGQHEAFVQGLIDYASSANTRLGSGSPLNTLTSRELDIMRDLSSPMTLAEIATAHSISLNTAKT